MNMNYLKWIAQMMCALTLFGCATVSTTMDGQWVAEGPDRNGVSNLFVLALTPDHDIAASVEASVAGALADHGITAHRGHEVLPVGFANDDVRALLGEAVAATGSDSVIVISYVKSDTRSTYIAPREEQIAVPDFPVFIGYRASAGFHYETVFTPGYYKTKTDYFLQTSVYRVMNEQLLWQAQSKVINPGDIDSGINSFSQRLITALKHDRVLSAGPQQP